MFGRNRKRTIRYAILGANLILLISVLMVVLNQGGGKQSLQPSALSLNKPAETINPLDQLSSADIAVHIARVTNLEEATSVANKADTVNAQLSITPADDSVVAKPQVVNTAIKTRKDIVHYITQAGDTLSTLATKFGVTSDSIKWSNSLTSSTLAANKDLYIPPINGIAYQVKKGDTPESLAAKYHANRDQIVFFNDAEISGLPVGEWIVIPDGSVVAAATSSSIYSGGFAWGGFSPLYGSNGYDYGYCTWWAAVRRAQVGKPIPSNLGNASTWKVLAQRAGLGVGNTPAQYAVIWTPPRDYYGHVGFVESVDADGTTHISEMNAAGWARVTYRTLSPAEAAGYSYIY